MMRFVRVDGRWQQVAVEANPLWESLLKQANEWSDSYYDFISWSYTSLTKMITTFPIEIFANDQTYRMQALFAGYSVLMVTLLAIKEGFKGILGFTYTRFTTIVGRTFIALVGAGLTVPALIWLIECANLVVQLIISLGTSYFGGNTQLGDIVKEFSATGAMNFIASLLFMLAFLFFICTALLKVGRRWFDLLMNIVISPFAWAAYVTDGTAKYLSAWIQSTGKILLTNVVYAFYVVVLSTIVIAPGEIHSVPEVLARILLILGGLYRLSSPPSWIRGLDGGGSIMPVLKDAAQLMTFRKFKRFGRG